MQVFSVKRIHLLKRHRQKFFNLCLLIVFIIILLVALVPGTRRFEVQVLAKQIGFETALPTDESNRRFLNSIRNLDAFSLTGSYPDPIVLMGQFNSKEFGDLTELAIEMPYDKSQIEFQPIKETNSDLPHELEVLALWLQDRTTVDALRYVPFSRRLDLQFSHVSPPPMNEGSFFELYLGQQPLQLTLKGYRLSVVGKALEDPDANQPLTFTYQPGITAELALALPQSGIISLSLPQLTDIDTLPWFWGDLPVSKIAFSTEYRRETDSLDRSTIITGRVRMGEQELDIESDQFLTLKEPGIQWLRYLSLVENQGIEVRAMGETSLAQVGLDPDFPMRDLNANLISQWLRPDIVVAIVSFSGAMVASLISWFVENLFKATDDDN